VDAPCSGDGALRAVAGREGEDSGGDDGMAELRGCVADALCP
jgi:hypothetical protein